MNTNVKVRLLPDTATALEQMAVDNDRSVSAEIRLAINARIAEHKATRKGAKS